MGLTLKTDEKTVKVFRKDREWSGGTFATYSVGVSSKDKDGNWVNGYLDVLFKKDVEVANKTEIEIVNAFPIVTTGKDGRTFVKWMITDFVEKSSGEPAPVKNNDFLNVADDEIEELPFK